MLEAKRERLNPLTGKEQARRYARSLDCRFVILSNGNLHYFWDLKHGNPNVVAAFPKPDAVAEYERRDPPDRGQLAAEPVGADYIALTQRPDYASEAAWRNEDERAEFIRARGLRFLRPYQTDAIHALQRAARDGADRFLFEMATGTGKTLTAAAAIKLFLNTSAARRALFLVDRLELEAQAERVFRELRLVLETQLACMETRLTRWIVGVVAAGASPRRHRIRWGRACVAGPPPVRHN